MIITTASSIALLENWYSNSLLPLPSQFSRIMSRIDEFVDLRDDLYISALK
jgi:hypothetical protein